MKRGKPMRRGKGPTRKKRPGKGPVSAYRGRERDTEYMRWVKTLPCAAGRDLRLSDCQGATEADHAGRRGVGRKCSDREVIPLCWFHHYGSRGAIIKAMDWKHDQIRAWLDRMISETQAQWPGAASNPA